MYTTRRDRFLDVLLNILSRKCWWGLGQIRFEVHFFQFRTIPLVLNSRYTKRSWLLVVPYRIQMVRECFASAAHKPMRRAYIVLESSWCEVDLTIESVVLRYVSWAYNLSSSFEFRVSSFVVSLSQQEGQNLAWSVAHTAGHAVCSACCRFLWTCVASMRH